MGQMPGRAFAAEWCLSMTSLIFDRKAHWEAVYGARPAEEVSWYQERPVRSLELVERTGFGREAAVIDIGGGASRFVDYLLEQGYRDLTVLDLSSVALERAAERLGRRAEEVCWIEADITQFEPLRPYDLWHDRAAFHFLTDAADRHRYREVLRRSVAPGGQVILATFAPGGPEKCSGLDIVQYDAARLEEELGPEFSLQEQQQERHRTPAGREQLFGFYRFLRIGR